jgi:hypothetical protein
MTTLWRLTTACLLFVLVATGTYTPISAFDQSDDLTSVSDTSTPAATTTKPVDPRVGMMTPGLRRRELEKDKEKLRKEKELEENPVPTGPVTSYEDEEEQDSTTDLIEGQANLDVSIVVPHMKKSASSLTAFPWPVAPPRVKAFPPPLPEAEKQIKALLLASGYTNRISADTPYPTGGWRFVHALRTAVRKSGMSMPHTILEHYGWMNRMMDYIIPEITASNNIEEMRFDAFKKVEKENLETEQRIRNEALRQGLEATILKPKDEPAKSVGKHFEATVKPSKWWVVGVHKAPGLKYYWHHPVEVAEGKLNRVVLTESNAIYIEGSW